MLWRSVRFYSSAARLRAHRVPGRALLRVRGPDTETFLQGVVTNDVTLLAQEGRAALYAHLLNVQGRTLYDVIIYSLKEPPKEPPEGLNSVLLECDSSVLDSVTKHLKTYKIRRKVTVDPCPDLSLWALLPTGMGSSEGRQEPEPTVVGKALVLVEDPRTELMGWRLVTIGQEEPHEFIAACQQGDTAEYLRHRYQIGLPEGVRDLPPGEALPLESNLHFMNGISFSKGCYLGQELTARTHHTGVIRKRLMPLRLSIPAESLQDGATLESPDGKPAGKHRAGVGEVGLGLVRLAHATKTLRIKCPQDGTVTAQASVPDWWPKQSKT